MKEQERDEQGSYSTASLFEPYVNMTAQEAGPRVAKAETEPQPKNESETLEVVEVRGDDYNTLALLLWLLLTPSVLMGTLLILSWSWFTALIAVLIGFIVVSASQYTS